MGVAPDIKFIEKSISLFSGNPGIYLKTSSYYFSTAQSSTFGTLSLCVSSMCVPSH
jgi:hypothetical protein